MSTATQTSHADHLAWCKSRALEYIDIGNVNGAYTSMVSDLARCSGTAYHSRLDLGMAQMKGGMLSTPDAMRHFIDGFN